jgi:AcrR family transcriptional regulator
MNSSILAERIVPFQCYAGRVRNTEGPLSGRRRQAARNDVEILDAAREVFLADPTAPVAAVAARAQVGISALYRRYPSKEDLTRELARDGLTRYGGELSRALADDGDPWTVYADCLTRILDGGSQALAQRLAGTFTLTPDLTELAKSAGALARAVHERAQRDGALRADVSPEDVSCCSRRSARSPCRAPTRATSSAAATWRCSCRRCAPPAPTRCPAGPPARKNSRPGGVRREREHVDCAIDHTLGWSIAQSTRCRRAAAGAKRRLSALFASAGGPKA